MASLIPHISVRGTNTVNFFMRYNSATLWKTMTGLSAAGKKKGRLMTRMKRRMVSGSLQPGVGPLAVQYTGLTTRMPRLQEAPGALHREEEYPGLPKDLRMRKLDEVERKTYLDLQHSPVVTVVNPEENAPPLQRSAERIEERRKRPKKYRVETLHPLQRGFTGPQIAGQQIGPPFPIEGNTYDDFQSYLLEIKRTQNMEKTGRVTRFSALVVTGNGKGVAGWAICKAPSGLQMLAIVKARQQAARRLCYVELLEGRTIFQAFGIKDIYVKVESNTTNYRALTVAFFAGLMNQETHQKLADRTRLNVVEMSANTHYYPKVVASPLTSTVKDDEEVLPEEMCDLDDYYGAGRYPYAKPKPPPFWLKHKEYHDKLWREHPFRNQEKVKFRLMADGFVDRWTRDSRKNWSEDQHQRAISGEKIIPTGIGLSRVMNRQGSTT